MFGKMFLLCLLSTGPSFAELLTPIPVPKIDELLQDAWPTEVKKMATAYPKGQVPKFVYTAPVIPSRDMQAINFYAYGPADNTGVGDQGCHGSIPHGDIIILAADFFRTKLCPSGGSGDGNNDDLEGNGASFTITGNLANCRLHWYNATGCNTKDWAGYMTGAMQRKPCMAPLDQNMNLIQGLRSFDYVCPDV